MREDDLAGGLPAHCRKRALPRQAKLCGTPRWGYAGYVNVWLRALIAVLVGNVLYFVVLTPVLPPDLRHQPFAYDLGLAIDFVICLALYLALGRIERHAAEPQP